MTVGTVTGSAIASTANRTFTHVNDGNYLVVVCGIADPNAVITGATYNTVAMTRLKSQDSANYGVVVFGLANPTAGSNSVVVSFSADTVACTAVSLITASADGATAAGAASGSTVDSVSITTTVDNSITVGVLWKDVAVGVVGTGTVEQFTSTSAPFRFKAFTETIASHGATTVGYDGTGSSGQYAIAAVEITPGTVSSFHPRRQLTGIG